MTSEVLNKILAELRIGLVEILGDRLEAVYLFGSQARGDARADSDIDVLVVGRPSQLAVARAERTLSDRLGREVSVIVVPAQDWEAGDSGFLQHVREGPLVPLPIAERD